jgi:hypothetical protein
MNGYNRQLTTLAALVLIACIFCLEQSVSAKSGNDCMNVKGNTFGDFSSGTTVTTGTIRQGGILNGTTEITFSTVTLPTPDPEAISFISDHVATTKRGVLTTRVVYVFDFVRAVAASIHRIDPNASTGLFSGATGVLYANDRLDFQSFTAEGKITGEICFAER